MKFFFARKDHICLQCRTEISKGEAFVRLSISNRQGTGEIGLLFHPMCYSKWNEEKFVQRFLEWKRQQVPPKKRGRPRKHADPKMVNRLKALQRYHEKAGNEARVKELEAKLRFGGRI